MARNSYNPDDQDAASEPEIFVQGGTVGTGHDSDNNNNSNDGNANNDDDESGDIGTGRQIAGAAAACGLAGLILVGPVTGLVAAGGAAVCATTRGKPGDVARAGGEAVAAAGDKLGRLNKEHRVTEKATRGIRKAGESLGGFVDKRDATGKAPSGGIARAGEGMKKFDDEHDVTGRATTGIGKAREGLKKFDDKHDVTGKASRGIVRGCNWVTKKMQQPPRPTTAAQPF